MVTLWSCGLWKSSDRIKDTSYRRVRNQDVIPPILKRRLSGTSLTHQKEKCPGDRPKRQPHRSVEFVIPRFSKVRPVQLGTYREVFYSRSNKNRTCQKRTQ